MKNFLEHFGKAIDEALKELKERDTIREEIIRRNRDADRLIRRSIMLIHLGRIKEAESLLKKAKDILEDLRYKARNFPDLIYGGILNMSFQEYVEALALLLILREGRIPAYREANVPVAPYLSGLADTIGELRRKIVDLIREGQLRKAELLFNAMESLYLILREVSYPEALVPGLRRKCDTARHLIELTRAGLVEAKLKLELLEGLKKVLKGIEGSNNETSIN